MATMEIEEVGGIQIVRRSVPAWLVVVGLTIMTIASWYLLSFSSTDYRGSYPKPELVVEDAGGGGH